MSNTSGVWNIRKERRLNSSPLKKSGIKNWVRLDGQFSLKCPNISSIYHGNGTFYHQPFVLLKPLS